jgi:hypothetical protein
MRIDLQWGRDVELLTGCPADADEVRPIRSTHVSENLRREGVEKWIRVLGHEPLDGVSVCHSCHLRRPLGGRIFGFREHGFGQRWICRKPAGPTVRRVLDQPPSVRGEMGVKDVQRQGPRRDLANRYRRCG